MTPGFDYDLVAIGSGPAGQRAAVQAAKLGRRAAVVEKRRIVGGVCLDTGTIPSKTLREAVLSWSATTGRADGIVAHATGLRPSPDDLFSRVQAVVAAEARIVEDQLRRNGVDLIPGEAAFETPTTLVVRDGEHERKLTAEYTVVAVGTRPAAPDGLRPDGSVVLSSDDVVAMPRIPRSMTIIGAGVIGIEYASMFAAIGVEVTIVDRRERPLEFLDREIVDELVHQMRGHGATFRLGEAVERLEVRDDDRPAAVVVLESGKRIVSETALVSTGRVGQTERLRLDAAGVKTGSRGRIEVDATYRTSAPNVFAAGDVIGFPSLAATSSEQGRLAACAAFGIDAGPMEPHFPVGIYAIPEISMVGRPEHELTDEKIPYETGLARYREIARGQILGDDTGLFKMIFHRDDGRLLGAHAIGTGATELIHIGQAVLGLGGGIDYFLKTVFNYPTLAECYKVAALDAYNKLRA